MQPVPLPFRELPGLVSARALADHYKLYLGYIEKVGAAHTGLSELALPDKTLNSIVSRGLQDELAYSLAGVVTHELYFGQLSAKPVPVGNTALSEAIRRVFGSVDAWWTEMKVAGMAARGWASFGIDDQGRLIITTQDVHDGAVPGTKPLVLVDVYEHAYWMDFGTDKAGYLDAIPRYLCWKVLEERFTAAIS
jgi:superoxide dismutase, Fe-Mn family